jgi:PilZ domain
MEQGEGKRDTERHRVLKPAQIVLSRNVVFDCAVRDVSTSGAQLNIPSTIGIPDEFDLVIKGAPARRCRVVWRKADQIGVEFS